MTNNTEKQPDIVAENRQVNKTPNQKVKWSVIALATLLAFGALIGAVLYTKAGVEAKKNQKRDKKIEKTLPTVHFSTVLADNYSSSVVAFGEVKNRYNFTLSSEVSGKASFFSPKLAVGQRLKKGEKLLTVAQDDYEKAIASRESALASAELTLLEEQRKRKQAILEWEESGLTGEPDSPLVFREPQIKVAKASLKDAQLALAQSKKDLADTQITAPFDAVVTAVNLQPKGIVQAGQNLATLASTDRAEIALPLTIGQWAQLPSQSRMVNKKWQADITASDGLQTNSNVVQLPSWQGYVTRVGQTVDTKTRQRTLIVAVNRPLDKQQPLFAGSFVKVSLQGKRIDNLWKIPSTSMSQSGDIWYLDDNNCLQKQAVSPLFTRGEYMFLVATQPSMRLVLSPLNSYVSGMCVNAVSTDKLTQAEQTAKTTQSSIRPKASRIKAVLVEPNNTHALAGA